MTRTIVNTHQELANRSDFEDELIWELLSVDEEDVLEKKIEELVPDQKHGQDDVLELRKILCNSIWSQRLDPNHKSFTIIYVLVTAETDVNRALESKEFSSHPVYVTQNITAAIDKDEKCIFYEHTNTVFIDEGGRAYEDWHLYLKENVLPSGTMVAPHCGRYTFNEDGLIKLEICPTPASKIVSSKPARTINDIQQDFANSSGYRNEVIWDLLSQNQEHILKHKIKELIPEQGKRDNAINELRESLSKMDTKDNSLPGIIYAVQKLKELAAAHERGQKALVQLRETLFKSIWAQRKYTNRNSLTAIIYMLVTKETDLDRAKESQEFSCHPVFRARKCVADSDSSKCCMLFIDELGRVYQDWHSYLSENLLPKGTMIAPKDGIYTFDEKGLVQLEISATPESSITRKVMTAVDTTSAMAGFASACIPLAAVLTIPVAGPVVAVAAVVGLTAAGYSTFRSGANLVERSQHQQSIGLRDRQARNNWIGVVAGVVGLGASGATNAMAAAAAAGHKISVVTTLVVNGMNISSIVLSGTGVANGVLDIVLKYNDDEDISVLDILQLSASLVLFTNSVNNFRLASKIVNGAQHGSIKVYRASLSNRQRRMFDKMSKENIRIRGEALGKMDIIRSVDDIPSKQILNDLAQVNLARSAEILYSRNSNYINVNSTKIVLSSGARALKDSTIVLPNGVKITLAQFGQRMYEHIVNAESFENVITTMARIFCEDAFRFLMDLARSFIDTMLDEIQSLLKIFVPSESVLYRIMMYCLDTYTERTYKFLQSQTLEIADATRDYFIAVNPNCSLNKMKKCKHCPGYYAVCDL